MEELAFGKKDIFYQTKCKEVRLRAVANKIFHMGIITKYWQIPPDSLCFLCEIDTSMSQA